MTDPVRWSQDPNAPDGLRELLRAAPADEPTAVELGRLRGRVLAPKAAAVLSAKLVVIGVLVVGIAAAIVDHTLTRSTPRGEPIAIPQLPTPTRPVPSPPPRQAAEPPPPTQPAAPAKHTARPIAKPVRESSSPVQDVVVPPPPVEQEPVAIAPPPAKPRVSEVALLEQARTSLRSGNPAAALALADRAAAHYPDGVLGEEREALAIEALIKLGRTTDARAKWSRFASSYPRSNYRARLQHYFQ